MLRKEDFVVIQALVKRGVYVCDIARQLGVHPKTVNRMEAQKREKTTWTFSSGKTGVPRV